MSKKDVYVYTPTVNIEKYEKLDSEERKDYLSLDKRMHRITEGFAYDVGKVWISVNWYGWLKILPMKM